MAADFPSLYFLLRVAVDKLVDEIHTDKAGRVNDEYGGSYNFSEFHYESDFHMHTCSGRYANKSVLYDEIHRALVAISDAYSDEKLKSDPRRDLFEDPIYRCSYVYLYFASHSHLVKRFLMEAYLNSGEFRVIFDKLLHSGLFLKICAVGGGPGTDVIGLVLFLRQLDMYKKMNMIPTAKKISPPNPDTLWKRSRRHGRNSGGMNHPYPIPTTRQLHDGWSGRILRERNPPVIHQDFANDDTGHDWLFEPVKPCRIRAIILDNCQKWSETCNSTFPVLRPLWDNSVGFVEKVAYGQVDLTSPEFLDRECTALEFADIVTMVKVVSAIAGSGQSNENARDALWSIFNRLKPGCLVLFIDNSGGGSVDLVREAALGAKMKELYNAGSIDCRVPRGEDKSHLKFYHHVFDYEPQNKAKVAAIVWRR